MADNQKLQLGCLWDNPFYFLNSDTVKELDFKHWFSAHLNFQKIPEDVKSATCIAHHAFLKTKACMDINKVRTYQKRLSHASHFIGKKSNFEKKSKSEIILSTLFLGTKLIRITMYISSFCKQKQKTKNKNKNKKKIF